MKSIPLVLTILCSSYAYAQSEAIHENSESEPNSWFIGHSPINNANQSLLEGDLSSTFKSLVEVWQSLPAAYQLDNLNQLLAQSVSVDCGKSFFQTSLPSNIKQLRFSMERAYTLGQLSQHIQVYTTTDKLIQSITINQWPELEILKKDQLEPIRIFSKPLKQKKKEEEDETDIEYQYQLGKEVTESIKPGLYEVKFDFEDQSDWSSLLLIGNLKLNHQLVWHPDDTWSIQKLALLNPSCPSPELKVTAFSEKENQLEPIWEESYTSKYPTQMPKNQLSTGKYLLQIALSSTRYQGDIKIDQTQKITKNHAIIDKKTKELMQMFDNDMPNLTHEEQQKAVEKVQEFMASGMSTGEAIQKVADLIRKEYKEKE